jgi:hypothetical protein
VVAARQQCGRPGSNVGGQSHWSGQWFVVPSGGM